MSIQKVVTVAFGKKDNDVYEKLEAFIKDKNVGMATVIKQALREYLDKEVHNG